MATSDVIAAAYLDDLILVIDNNPVLLETALSRAKQEVASMRAYPDFERKDQVLRERIGQSILNRFTMTVPQEYRAKEVLVQFLSRVDDWALGDYYLTKLAEAERNQEE